MTHIAGIGASAGGLEAMLPMFAGLRATGRIRYVVAQHMAKDGHDALVVRLIQRKSALPVLLASSDICLKPDTVYVIPSGKDGLVKGDALSLVDPAPEHVSTPSVNALFNSIAKNQRFKAIGVVLSGTGSDGASGCRAIRAAGGLILVQDPTEAKFNGMPQAALDANAVDYTLPVHCMGDTLATLFPGQPSADWRPQAAVPHKHLLPVTRPDVVTDPGHQELQHLLRQVLEATGIDFSSYKEDTLLRRLDKRKLLHGITSPEAYRALIHRNPAELHILQHLFLVSVSSFFRDNESFKRLRQTLAQVLAHKPAGLAVEVWVPGCASGEEVYTLAIILRELVGEERPVRITGSDLNPQALQIARDGVYRLPAFKEMDPDQRERYFTPRGDDFEVRPELRACVQFERRDVLTGAPKSGLDLVSCRNLLIYMKSRLQDKLIKSFHQCLNPQGLLFIGQSESLSFVGNSLFSPVDHYHRIFRRRH